MMKRLAAACLLTALSMLGAQTADPPGEGAPDMVNELAQATGLGTDHFLIQAFSGVDRAAFLPREYAALAQGQADIPLGPGLPAPSALSLIRLLDEALLEESDRVLLVGDEGAYAATALSRAGMEVYLIGDGAPATASYGVKEGSDPSAWLSAAPFDFIMIMNPPVNTVPPALMEQLSLGGTLVAPLISENRRLSWIRLLQGRQRPEIYLLDGGYDFPLF